MHHFPAHVPILECSVGDQGKRPVELAEELSKRKIRVARISAPDDISEEAVVRLLLDHELILVENDRHTCSSLPAICQLTDVVGEPDLDNPNYSRKAAQQISAWVMDCRLQTPVFGGVLIGGKSSRMGHPKHLIQEEGGRSWLEHLICLFNPFVTRQVISGAGELPGSMQQIDRVDDVAGVQGPLAGVGALLGSPPFVSWLVCACDMPHVSPAAIEWLLDQRGQPGAAVIPENPETGRSEPLFAWYDYRCKPLIDDLISSGSRKISDLCSQPTILQPKIPQFLVPCWRNINYPDQL